jgi:PAS domain S-box-containing protein
MANNITGDRSTLLSTSEPTTAIILQLADGKIAACNPAIAEILGYTAEELIGKTPFDLPWKTIYPDGSAFLPADYPAIAACQTGQLSIDVSMGFYRPDGELVWLKLDAQPLFRASESAPYAVVTTISKSAHVEVAAIPFVWKDRAEIAECQQAEAALRESEARFRQIAETIEDVFWVSNPWERQIYYLSPAYERIWVRSRERAYTDYQSWYESIHPDDRPRLKIAFFEQIQAGNFDAQYRIVRPDGSIRWIHDRGFAIKDEFGNFKQVVGIAEDISERQQAEVALRESEQRLHDVANNVPSIVWTAAPDGTITWVSQDWYAYTGITPEQNARNWPQVLHPDDLDRCLTQWERALEEGSEYKVEVRNRRHDGEYRWFLTQATPRRDRAGRITAWFGSTTDIDDLKCVERRLQESEELLHLGMQVAGFGIAKFNYAANTVELSPEAAVLYGLPADRLVMSRSRLHATFHPEDREQMARSIEQALDPTGSGWLARDCRVVWPNGEVRWLSVRKQVFFDRFSASPKPTHAIQVALDITARKQAEESLRQSEEFKNRMLDSSPDCIKVLDLDGRLTYMNAGGMCLMEIDDFACYQLVWTADAEGVLLDVNQRWIDYTGVTLDRVRVDGWATVVHPDDAPAMNDRWRLAQTAGSHYQAEGRMRRADGIYRWHLHQAMPLTDDRGQIVKWFGTATDIHDRIELEIQRDRLLAQERESRAEAERANRLKDEFLTVISHELRTPLNPILGWVQILQRGKFKESRLTEGLAAIERNAKQQSQLIEDLLDISRVMRGKLTLKSIAVSLVPVISAALETVRLAAEAKNLQLHLEVDANVGRILGDAGRLQQVMWNLLSNAVKFTPKGGRIEVRLERVERGREGEEIFVPKSVAQISVADTGKGISAEFLPYVFDYFRQEDGSTTRHFGGLGLGMSMARQIVEIHGGTIWVESPGEGRGATFFVQFPLLPEATVPQPKIEMPAAELSDSLPLAGIRVLAIDDDPDNLQFLTLVLQENGAIVTAAASASEGLKIAQQTPLDLVISDIGMPEMDGYGLLAAIRSLPSAIASVPAIALTAYAQEIDRQRALAVGFQEHLAKPIESELLVAKILSAVNIAERSS